MGIPPDSRPRIVAPRWAPPDSRSRMAAPRVLASVRTAGLIPRDPSAGKQSRRTVGEQPRPTDGATDLPATPLLLAAGTKAQPKAAKGAGYRTHRRSPQNALAAMQARTSGVTFSASSAASCSNLHRNTPRTRALLCDPCALLRRILSLCPSEASRRFASSWQA